MRTIERNELDPVSLEILWGRLIGIVDETAVALVRTAFSTIVAESNDYACVLFDDRGLSLAQSSWSVPSFIGTMPRTLQAYLEKVPRSEWREGDVIISNNPWIGTGHFPDVTMALPIFRGQRLVAFAGTTIHLTDIGGNAMSTDAQDIFEEGLHIPICHLYREGRAVKEVFDFISHNVRTPDLVIGDLRAQVSAGQVMASRLKELMDEQHLDDLNSLAESIIARSEDAMRASIAQIPDGIYAGEVWLDGLDQPLRICATVTVDGTNLTVDYDGTSPQVNRGLNSVLNYTRSYTLHALKCVLNPLIPNNDGSNRPINVTAPSGTLVNPSFPAPVTARNVVGHYLHAAIFRAFATVVPDRIIAESGAPANRTVIRGRGYYGDLFGYQLFTTGGMGAGPWFDGLNCTAFPTNGGAAPIEITEARVPIFFVKKEMLADSGGPGEFRGGLGQEVVFRVLPGHPVTISPVMDRIDHPPAGVAGGGPGAPALITVDGKPVPPKSRTALRGGEVVRIVTPGGGGYGDPEKRRPNSTKEDLRDGLVSASVARQVYRFPQTPEE